MKKYISILFTVAAGLVLSGCNKGHDIASSRSITVTASIGSMTKVAYDGDKSAFEAGDSLALFAWLGDKTAISKDLVVDNVTNILGTDGLWQPKTQMLWDNTEDPHYFMAVAPARAVKSFTADPYTLDSAAEKYQESDLLIAINDSGVTAADNPVSLSFEHAMAKLNVNLTFRNQWTEGNPPSQTEIAEALIGGVEATAKDHATIDYIHKAVTATGEAAGVAMNQVENASWTTLMVPQEGFRTLTITLSGNSDWLGGNGTYVFTHSADIPLVSGKVTTVNLLIGRDQITLAKDGISIVDWAEEATIDGKVIDPTQLLI